MQVGFPAHLGGPELVQASLCLNRLGKLFDGFQEKAFSPKVARLGIFFEVEGSLDFRKADGPNPFAKSGVVRVAINGADAKHRPSHAMCTVRLPRSLHEGKSVAELRKIFADCTIEAFGRLVKACDKKGYPIEAEAMMDAVHAVLATFLADEGEYPPGPADFEIAARLQALEDIRRLADALGEPEPDLREFLRVQERLERGANEGGG